MSTIFLPNGLPVLLTRKPIKYIRCSVHPPHGDVRVSAPRHVRLEDIQGFLAARQDWIERQRQRILARPAVPPCRYVDGERLRLWGDPLLLRVEERNAPARTVLENTELRLTVRPDADMRVRERAVEAWRRRTLLAEVGLLLPRWQETMGVTVRSVSARRMKSRWGSCTPAQASLRLSTTLVSLPREFLEYVLVHELAHLMERSHNARFYALMDKYIPQWPTLRRQLNGHAADARVF